MTKLKDKLSASLRQAKASTQAVAPVTVKTSRSPAPTAAKPVAAKPTAPKPTAPKPVAPKPVATQPSAHSGIAFPDRVWPD